MDFNQKTTDLRKRITNLGKEVAESNSTTKYPDWIHFKIGISTLEGIQYDDEFWKKQIKPNVKGSSN